MNPGVQLMWTLKPESTLKGVDIMVTAPAVVRQEQVIDFLFKDFIEFFFLVWLFLMYFRQQLWLLETWSEKESMWNMAETTSPSPFKGEKYLTLTQSKIYFWKWILGTVSFHVYLMREFQKYGRNWILTVAFWGQTKAGQKYAAR